MRPDQLIFGTALAMVSLAGLAFESWILANTRKGRFVTERFGVRGGRWALRAVLCGFVLLGTLLALDLVRPIQWK